MITHKNIPDIWLKTSGRKTKTAVCDSGCDIYKLNNVRKYRVFGYEDVRHGTNVCGIIETVARHTELYVTGTIHMGINYQYLYDTLIWLKQFQPHVLNLSFGYKQNNDKIRNLLKQISRKTLIICANSNKYPYPATYDSTITVGSSFISKNSDLIVLDYFKKPFDNLKGTSIGCAYVSGIASLAKSYDLNINKQDFLSILTKKQYVVNENIEKNIIITL